ncbi:uncharacterized protein LOC105159086 [Olea europaea subsp. europaea]|uniref:Uncharacterized protein LOC105159086, partial n=1 Tax=Olea europaea subsp. europaea TaxID=158383 RepID=A0A8S0UA42_OLEEU|nr:uncharacterized protein LOC105159086 [Olea europaea subsp. europaea]
MVPLPLLTQAPAGGALISATQQSSLKFTHPIPPLFTKRRPHFSRQNRLLKPLTLANAAEPSGSGPSAATKPSPATASTPFSGEEPISIVGQESVPLEGVIQFEKPNSDSRLAKWGRVALLAGGDVAALLLFSAIGRFSHGFSALDFETLKTADPFIAGWFLSAYFLGGYGEDGRGMNGQMNAVTAAAKSWFLGIPLGMIIRAITIGHTPPTNFILVTMGSTAVLLIGWRALLFNILPYNNAKKNDVYKRGSPFELFEKPLKSRRPVPDRVTSSRHRPPAQNFDATTDVVHLCRLN